MDSAPLLGLAVRDMVARIALGRADAILISGLSTVLPSKGKEGLTGSPATRLLQAAFTLSLS